MYDPLDVRLPVARYRVSPHGGYAFVRETPADGACGIGTHPCTHPGLDMVPLVPHDWCVAPERSVVRYVARDNDTSPLRGYGPCAVLLAGTWLGRRVWHVLGHLDPKTLVDGVARGRVFRAGERIARISLSANHVHWEIRKVELPPRGDERIPLTLNPLRWLRERELAAAALLAGACVGGAIALSRWR